MGKSDPDPDPDPVLHEQKLTLMYRLQATGHHGASSTERSVLGNNPMASYIQILWWLDARIHGFHIQQKI